MRKEKSRKGEKHSQWWGCARQRRQRAPETPGDGKRIGNEVISNEGSRKGDNGDCGLLVSPRRVHRAREQLFIFISANIH